MQADVHPAALTALAAAIAAELDIGGTPAVVCDRLAPILSRALATDDLAPLFVGRDKSYEAYRDPKRGFLLHASVHAPQHLTRAHDHAESWAVYGMYRGKTAYRLYERGLDAAPGLATLGLLREAVAERGEVAIVLPGQVHENWNPSDEVSWNLVIRPRPLRELWRRTYDPTSGAYRPL